MQRIVLIIIFLFITSCTENTVYAPVTEISTIEPLPKTGVYRVMSDDSLYSIAWRYGLDYRYLAKINTISRPYPIHTGQLIHLRGQEPHPVQVKKVTTTHVTIIKQQLPAVIEKEPAAAVSYWHWPARGPVVASFNQLNKGINIGGHLGSPVYAAAPGKVVYSGNGLRAYGNLIIIKHNSVFLSAYGYNSRSLVKEGQWVKAGQQIAEMGTNSNRDMLHFEIRQSGNPVNPLRYLAKR